MAAHSLIALLLTAPLASLAAVSPSPDGPVQVTITLEAGADAAETEQELALMGISSRFRPQLDKAAAQRDVANRLWLATQREKGAETGALSDAAETIPPNPLDNFKWVRKERPPLFDSNNRVKIWVDADEIDDIEALDNVRDVTPVDQQ